MTQEEKRTIAEEYILADTKRGVEFITGCLDEIAERGGNIEYFAAMRIGNSSIGTAANMADDSLAAMIFTICAKRGEAFKAFIASKLQDKIFMNLMEAVS